jgi:hypothetical protein
MTWRWIVEEENGAVEFSPAIVGPKGTQAQNEACFRRRYMGLLQSPNRGGSQEGVSGRRESIGIVWPALVEAAQPNPLG